MRSWAKYLCWVGTGVLLLSLSSTAQVAVGDNVKLGLSGELSTGYTGTFGDGDIESSHSLSLGGSGSLHGFYYSPQFLSFDVKPYYNRSQANSAFQSITDSSGLNGTVNIFSGSHFPGSVSYGKTFDTLGQFGFPGVTGLSTDSSGSSLEINWAALFPNRPSLNVSYVLGNQDASVFGSSDQTHLHTGTLNLHSNYNIDGFQLTGFYIRQAIDASFPTILDPSGTTIGSTSQNGGNQSFGAIGSHKIPLKGYWSANITHNTYDSNTGGGSYNSESNGSSNSFSSTASISPIHNLGLSLSGTYQTNLLGALQAQIINAGGNAALANTEMDSKAILVRSDAYYTLTSHLTLNGQWNHIEQYLNGKQTGVTQFGGGVTTNYTQRLFGTITFNAGAVDTATQEGNSGAGLYGNVGYSRKMGGWETDADFNYAQQVQTLGYIYTTSVYGYGTSVRRRFGNRFYWTSSARASHSGLVQQEGTDSHSQNFSSTVVYRGYSATGIYSQAGGAAIVTAQGLVPIPIGIPTPLVNLPVTYNATSYGGGVAATLKKLSISANYTRALSDTSATTFAHNDMGLINGLLRCRFRKLYFDAGYTRFSQTVQNIGTVGAQAHPPSNLNTYFFGISRWFNVF